MHFSTVWHRDNYFHPMCAKCQLLKYENERLTRVKVELFNTLSTKIVREDTKAELREVE